MQVAGEGALSRDTSGAAFVARDALCPDHRGVAGEGVLSRDAFDATFEGLLWEGGVDPQDEGRCADMLDRLFALFDQVGSGRCVPSAVRVARSDINTFESGPSL